MVEQIINPHAISRVNTVCSDFHSSTLKQEEEQTPEQFMIKLRKKVCRKIFQILTKELGQGIMDSQDVVVSFESAIFKVFSNNNVEYLQAVKTVCNKVRV